MFKVISTEPNPLNDNLHDGYCKFFSVCICTRWKFIKQNVGPVDGVGLENKF